MTTQLRVAVCSSDGRMVDEHFGTTTQFLILDIQEGRTQYVDTRTNEPSCHPSDGHSADSLARSLELISDCQILLTVRAGPPVLARLAAQGIKVVQVNASIADALGSLIDVHTKEKATASP